MILLGSGFTATRGTQPPDVPTPLFCASATDATSRPTPAASITALKSLIVALENLIVAPPFGPVYPRSGRLRPRSLLLSSVSCTPLVAAAAWPGNLGGRLRPPSEASPQDRSASRRTSRGWGPAVRGERSGNPSRRTSRGWGPAVRGERSGNPSRRTSRGWGPAVRGEHPEACAGKAGARTSVIPPLPGRFAVQARGDIDLCSAPRQLDHPGGARAHVLGGREVEAGLGQHLPAELHIGPFHAHHHRDLEPELLDGGDEALGQPVAAQDAAEDVDEDRLDAPIRGEDAEGVLDLLGRGAPAHVEEV